MYQCRRVSRTRGLFELLRITPTQVLSRTDGRLFCLSLAFRSYFGFEGFHVGKRIQVGLLGNQIWNCQCQFIPYHVPGPTLRYYRPARRVEGAQTVCPEAICVVEMARKRYLV